MGKYEEPIVKIQKAARNLKDLNDSLIIATKDWEKEIVYNIGSILLELKKSFNLGWVAGINYNSTPYSACLVLPKSENEIILGENNGFDLQLKHDGYLCYSLGINGHVNVWIQYPSIKYVEFSIPTIIDADDLKDKMIPKPIIIDTISLKDINEELIAGHVIIFLDKMQEYKTKGEPTILYGLNNIIYKIALNE